MKRAEENRLSDMLGRTVFTLLLLIVTGGLALAQQAPTKPVENNCGTVNCPAGCTCQTTPCDKTLSPGCTDVGICANCPPPTVQPVTFAGAIILILGGGLYWFWRRQRRLSGKRAKANEP